MKRNLLLVITLLLSSLKIVGQGFPIQVTTVIPPPYPQTWEESLGLGNNAFIILNNTDITQSHEIKLTAKITSDNGPSIEVLPEATPSQPIILAPGETRTVFGAELEALYLNYGEGDLVYSGVDIEQIISNPYLPEGSYTFCIKAFDYNSSAPLSNELLSGCAPPIYITTVSPPIITYPFDEQDVDALTPQQLIFSWTPVSFNSPNVRYAFQMVDYTDLSVNVYDLLNENDFQFFSEENITGNTLIYGPDKPTLIPNHDYAVRVKAYLLDGTLNIENGGFSDIVQFHYNPSNNYTFTDNFPIDFNPPDITLPPGDFTGNDFFDDFDFTDLYGFNPDDYTTVGTTGNTTTDNPPLVTNDLGCGGGCNPVVVSNSPAAPLEAGANVNIGTFPMIITTATGTVNGGYSGSGFIEFSTFSPLPVKVNFSGLKVNTDDQIIAGEAITEIRNGSWLENSWNDAQKNFSINTFGSNPQTMYDNIMDPDFRLETWGDASQTAAITLPAGYGSDEDHYQVQITKMVFGPSTALFDAMVMIRIPDHAPGTEAKHLVFTASDLCISPSGPNIGNSPAQLALSNTVRYQTQEEDEDFIIEISDANNANLGEGTFVELDCNGFFRASISGQVIFSPDFLVIENDDGTINTNDTLSASFAAEFENWDSWIGELSFSDQNPPSNGKVSSNRFQYAGLEGYTFKIANAKFDHDINANLPGMVFPTDYAGSTSSQWQGLFVNEMEVLMPKWAKDNSNDERMAINTQKLLIDASGLSGQFNGDNLATLSDASLGGWDFSVDLVRLKIVSNTLHTGALEGLFKMPISEDPFGYVASIDNTQNNTQHDFVISTTEEFEMPAFLSDITLAQNSSISVEILNGNDVQVEADLNGKISLPELAEEIPGCTIQDIDFQHMMIRNHDKLFEIGPFSTEGVEITVASVAVGLAGMAMTELEGISDQYELGFNLDFQLGESNAGVSGVGKLFVTAENQGTNPEDFQLNHINAGIDAFEVGGHLPGVDVNATVGFFNEENLGHGFAGEFNAKFIDQIIVRATAMFGSNTSGNGTKKFFMVEGMGISTTGFPLAPPVSVYGFGGGLYYNIAQTNNFVVANLESPDTTGTPSPIEDIVSNYTFQEGQLGIKAACAIGLTPPDVFNADVSLEVEINANNFNISSMALTGDGYMMTDIKDRSNPLMNIMASLEYNFTDEILDGQMAMNLSAPAGDDPLITANGTLEIYAGPTWYVKFGTPTAPVHGEVDLKVLRPSLDAYFMTGQNLPPPILPEHVLEQFPDYTPALNSSAILNGTGVSMGAHARVVSEIDVIVAYMNLDVGAGFDFTAMSYTNSLCNGSTEFGINQWYATVQGYVYGDISFTTLDYEWLSINAGLLVQGALPNPTGFSGEAHFEVETFIKDFSVHDDFSVGETCQMATVLNEDGEVVVASSPIQGLDIIKYVNPGAGDSEVDLFVQPKVQFHIDPNETMVFDYPLGNGQVQHEEIYFVVDVLWQEKVDGNFINVNRTEAWDEASKTFTYTKVVGNNDTQEISAPNTQHKFNVVVTPKDAANEYTVFTDEDTGNTLQEIRNSTYTTGKNITSINDAHIDFCTPYRRQRYVTPGDYENALVRFNVSYRPAFEAYEDEGYSFEAKIFKQGVAAPVIVDSINYDIDLIALYDISDLEPETIYKVVFTATNDIELETNNIDINNDTYTDATGINVTTNNFSYTDNNLIGNNSNNNTNSNTTTVEYVIDEQELFTYFFRTSKYNTIAEKINSYSVVNTSVETKPTNFNSGQLSNLPAGNSPSDFYTYNSVNMELAGGEPFDEFDLFAPRIVLPNRGMPGNIVDFRYAGSNHWYDSSPMDANSLSCDGMIQPAQNQFSPPTVLTEYADLNQFGIKSQFGGGDFGQANISFDLEYIGVSKPLSDSELLGTGGGSTQSTFGQLFNNNNNYNLPNTNMTLIFRGDLGGKELMCSNLCTQNNNIYQFMQSGDYNFIIKSNNIDMLGNAPNSFKNLNVNLQMP